MLPSVNPHLESAPFLLVRPPGDRTFDDRPSDPAPPPESRRSVPPHAPPPRVQVSDEGLPSVIIEKEPVPPPARTLLNEGALPAVIVDDPEARVWRRARTVAKKADDAEPTPAPARPARRIAVVALLIAAVAGSAAGATHVARAKGLHLPRAITTLIHR